MTAAAPHTTSASGARIAEQSHSETARVIAGGICRDRSRAELVYQALAVVAPFFGVVLAVASMSNSIQTWTSVAVFLLMYTAVGTSVTLGFHRLLTHRSYETTRAVKYALAVVASMSAQGYFFTWVAEHRRHHEMADRAGDPHSPHHDGSTPLYGWRGVLHAHVGWTFKPRIFELERYIPDLRRDPGMRLINRLLYLWLALGVILPGAAVWLVAPSVEGFASGVVWGGLLRIFFVNHTTWAVNSVCHMYGARNFTTDDASRDNPIVAVLALGEGWHNGHHAFPSSARHGLSPGQFDMSYELIRVLERCGLAWNVRLPSDAALAAKRLSGTRVPRRVESDST